MSTVGGEDEIRQGIYITRSASRSGKSIVVLGVMEMLAGLSGKAGFLRPTVLDAQKPDNITSLIIRRYDLKIPFEMLYGGTYNAARSRFISDKDEDFLKLIMEKYKTLEREFRGGTAWTS